MKPRPYEFATGDLIAIKTTNGKTEIAEFVRGMYVTCVVRSLWRINTFVSVDIALCEPIALREARRLLMARQAVLT